MRGVLLMAMMLTGAAQAERLAVLELKNFAGLEPAEARYLGERVRGVAQARAGESMILMTRANLLALLPPGTDLADCEGACEIETGRNIGADYVVSGQVVPFDQTLRAVLTLHRTTSGRQLAMVHAGGADLRALESDLARAADRLFDAVPELQRPVAVGRSRGTRVVVTSRPPGAEVWQDGQAIGVTPLTLEVGPAWRGLLELRLDEHVTQKRWIAVRGRTPRAVEVRMLPVIAPVQVRASDPDGVPCTGAVRVDRKEVGRAPWSGSLREGRHRIEVDCGHRMARRTVHWPQAHAQVDLVAEDRRVQLGVELMAPGGWQTAVGGWLMDRRLGQLRIGLEGHGGRYPLQDVDSGYEEGAWHVGLGMRMAVPIGDRLDWTVDLSGDVGWTGCADTADPNSHCARKDRADSFDLYPILGVGTGLRFDTGLWTFDGGLWMLKPFMYQEPDASFVPYVGAALAW